MSKTYISAALRRSVEERANDICEYCLIPLLYGFFIPYQIDHVISEKHGGETTLKNLALACKVCNSLKGSDIATFLVENEAIVRLFNPRKDAWLAHFELDNGELIAKTEIAEGTIKLLKLNQDSYVRLRKMLTKGNIQLVGLFEPTDN